jgi:hypothetical protein
MVSWEAWRTMGDRNARVGRPGDGAGDAGDDLKAHACLVQFRGFFRATAEQHGSPPFSRVTVLPSVVSLTMSLLISS